MSREIKFRVYDKTSGYYVAILDNDSFDIKKVARVILELEMLGHEYILEQYTGLKDKNGKEIYEGDIVKNIEGVNETAVCVWDESNAEFDFRCNDGKYTRDNVKSWLEMYEVIGNIHENPELLKERSVK